MKGCFESLLYTHMCIFLICVFVLYGGKLRCIGWLPSTASAKYQEWSENPFSPTSLKFTGWGTATGCTRPVGLPAL